MRQFIFSVLACGVAVAIQSILSELLMDVGYEVETAEDRNGGNLKVSSK